jgi:tetratricopeptide (TPR) repeat protein
MIWFLLSILSKPAAVIFPVALFSIDFFYRRKITLKLFAEKIPFIIIAGIIAFITLQAQVKVGATDPGTNFSLVQRIFFMFYGFMMYFFKMIVPLNLNAFYPYPPINADLPSVYYISPLFFIAVVIVCLMTYKKNPVITFGFSFYFINLILVLQLYLVGSAIIAERYTYIPYIGLFFIIGWLIDKWQNHSVKKALPYLVPLIIVLTAMTYVQAATWKNSKTLWEHAIKVNPNGKVYKNLAFLYNKEGNKDKELEYYNQSLKYNISDADVFTNRGNIYFGKQMFAEALADYNMALSINPNLPAGYASRGSLYGMQGKYDLAMNDLNKAIEINPESKFNYQNRALVWNALGKYNEAITDFYRYLKIDPENMDILNFVGVCYQKLNQHQEAIKVFNEVLSKRATADFYMNRSISWKALGNRQKAVEDAMMAKKAGGVLDVAYAASLGI